MNHLLHGWEKDHFIPDHTHAVEDAVCVMNKHPDPDFGNTLAEVEIAFIDLCSVCHDEALHLDGKKIHAREKRYTSPDYTEPLHVQWEISDDDDSVSYVSDDESTAESEQHESRLPPVQPIRDVLFSYVRRPSN